MELNLLKDEVTKICNYLANEHTFHLGAFLKAKEYRTRLEKELIDFLKKNPLKQSNTNRQFIEVNSTFYDEETHVHLMDCSVDLELNEETLIFEFKSLLFNISHMFMGNVLTYFITNNLDEISKFSKENYPSQDFIKRLNEDLNNNYASFLESDFYFTLDQSFLIFLQGDGNLFQEYLREYLFFEEDTAENKILGYFRLKDLNISEEDKAKLLEEWQAQLERFKPKILNCLNSVTSASPTGINRELLEELKKKEDLIQNSETGESNNPLYSQTVDILIKLKEENPDLLSPACLEAIDCYANIEARKPLLIPSPEDPPLGGETPPVEEEIPRNNACKEWEDYWGVKFTYKSTNIDGTGKAECVTSLSNSGELGYYSHEFILTLLPAMRSNLSKSGNVDVPNAMPGLQFQVKSNISKHKIPGFQPLYQHLGIESVIITMVGCFTGDGGISKISTNKAERINSSSDPENPYNSPDGISGSDNKGVSEEFRVLQEPSYEPWDKRANSINPISHPITEATLNRVLRNLYVEPYRFDNKKPLTATQAYEAGKTEYKGFAEAIMYGYSTSKQARKGGMFMRDGCPWSCSPEDEYSGEGRQPTNQGNADVTNTHTLLELAAYNDSYHEFTSFYRVAIEQGHEMEIEINMRQNRDHLNPQQNRFLKYGKDATGRFTGNTGWGPLRNNENGNPKFKGVVKAMEVYHARSDRTWYTMQIEVTDYGLIGEEPINLTNNLEQATLAALQATRDFVAQQEDADLLLSEEEANECGREIVETHNPSRIEIPSESNNTRYLYIYIGYAVIRTITRAFTGDRNSSSVDSYKIVTDYKEIISIIRSAKGISGAWETPILRDFLNSFDKNFSSEDTLSESPLTLYSPDYEILKLDGFEDLDNRWICIHKIKRTAYIIKNFLEIERVSLITSIPGMGSWLNVWTKIDQYYNLIEILTKYEILTRPDITEICPNADSNTNSSQSEQSSNTTSAAPPRTDNSTNTNENTPATSSDSSNASPSQSSSGTNNPDESSSKSTENQLLSENLAEQMIRRYVLRNRLLIAGFVVDLELFKRPDSPYSAEKLSLNSYPSKIFTNGSKITAQPIYLILEKRTESGFIYLENVKKATRITDYISEWQFDSQQSLQYFLDELLRLGYLVIIN